MITKNKDLWRFIAAIVVIFAFVVFTAAASAADIYVPEGGNQTIQQAVNNATAGDTIIVRDGTYYENVVVNKSVPIRSENGSALTIVNASNPNDHVFNVTTDWVNISGFTVQNATKWTSPQTAGIYLGNGVEHCNISDNNATNNYRGIWLYQSNNNTVYNNTANLNNRGICLYPSSNYNTITSNTANDNSEGEGIYLSSSSNNNLTNNTANDNKYGVCLSASSNINLTNNTANNNN